MVSRFVPLVLARLSAFILILVSAAAVWAEGPPAESPHIHVAVATSAGTITLELDATRAPLTTANFLRYVDKKRFDGTAFYRAMHLEWGEQPNGLIQGGTQNDPKRILKPVAHEPTSQTGILHKRGTISMARFAPGTATGDFSIMVSDQPGLDAQPQSNDPDTRAGFAAFGKVVAGMEVVDRIWNMPRSTTKGEGIMKGQMLAPPVRIVSARRVPAVIASSTDPSTGAP